MSGEVSRIVTKYVGDDWVFPFSFTNSGSAIDMSGTTFSASLITESPYTAVDMSPPNGSVDATLSSSGSVNVTVFDSLTSTLTADLDSVDMPVSGSTLFNTRLALYGTAGTIVTTYAIIPIRVVRR